MERRTILVAVTLAVTAFAAACSSEPAGAPAEGEAPRWTDITPAGLAGIIGDDSVLLVNVHVPYEGEIPGTDLFVPYDQVAEHLAELPDDPATKLVLYCRSGRMSEAAAATLAARGYTNLYNLSGGSVAWEAAGYELLTG